MLRWLRLQWTLWRRVEASIMFWLSLQMARLNPQLFLFSQTTFFINILISFTVKVTRSVNTGDGELSSQEQKTIKSIVAAR